ncbi:MAG: acetyl-CoA carboxylase biotin carboxyl carrier protein subunit, partial [Candidatus Contendobacter sp.]|nr:acetyl-CoA carboxylase biotin carboxyl carrier protein subunit [Candidatus Contendobacter sp.]
PDPAVVKLAIEQLKLEPFDGDPLEKAPDSIAMAEDALRERKLGLTDENIFLVASAIVPGKNMELNEGIRLLTGKAKVNLPLKSKEQPAEIRAAATPVPAAAPAAVPVSAATAIPPTVVAAPAFTAPMTTQCTVVEGSVVRSFRVTIEPPAAAGSAAAAAPVPAIAAPAPLAAAPAVSQTTPVFSPFEGKVELVDILVKVGDRVQKGHVVAAVEAMKAKHDVRAPCDGVIVEIHADLGSSVSAGKPILSIGG